jgi:hypothetical protein
MSRGAQKEAKQQLNTQNQYASGANSQAGSIFSTLFPQLQQEATDPTANNPELKSAGDQFQSEIDNPMGLSDIRGLSNTAGYTQGQINDMTTASNQALGGAVGGAVGQGNLEAARTHNGGGYATALDDAVRTAGRQQSQNVLGVRNDSAKLSAHQNEVSDQMLADQRTKSDEMKSANRNAGLTGLEGNALARESVRQSALSGMEGLYGQNINELMQMMGLGPQAINAETNAGNSGWLQNTLGIVNTLGGLGKDYSGLSSATGGFTHV